MSRLAKLVTTMLLAATMVGPVFGQDAELPLKGTLAVPVENEPLASTLERTHSEEWRRVTLRLAGSMCPACLLEVQNQMRAMPGVAFVKVDYKAKGERETTEPQNGVTTHAHRTAETVIIYDRHAIQWNTLQHYVGSKHYKCIDLSDEAYDSGTPK